MKRFPFISLFLLSALVMGCSSGDTIKAINRTASDIKTTIKSLYGVVSASDNNREIITGPLKVDPKDKTPSTQLKERAYARIVIVGDRRPYDVLLEAYIERKNPEGNWEEVGLDEELSRDLAKELHRALIESRESWNFIDDFRAF